MFIPVLDGEHPWAALCATAENDRLQENDFGFFVSLISLASAACAGHRRATKSGQPKPVASLAGVDTVDATPEELQTMAFPDFQKISENLRGSLRLDDWQKILIAEALRRTEGRIPEAAEELGISRATLYRKIEHLDLNREAFIRDDSTNVTQTELPKPN
jgi:transcriptional regulator of acetoin/glycerol metabolism